MFFRCNRDIVRISRMTVLGVLVAVILSVSTNIFCAQAAPDPLEEGIQSVTARIIGEITTRFYDARKRPLIRVCILDFTNQEGAVTVGSKYVSDRVRMALALRPQFSVIQIDSVGGSAAVRKEVFSKDPELRAVILEQASADAYALGTVKALDRYAVYIEVYLFDYKGEPILLERSIKEDCKASFNESGLALFNRVLIKKKGRSRGLSAGKAPVVFLTQPIDDDAALGFWTMSSKGLFVPQELRRRVSFKYDFGSIIESHSVSAKNINNVVTLFTLLIRPDDEGPAIPLRPYIIPRKSRYYLFQDDLTGERYRFKYIWYYPNKSDIPAPGGAGYSETFFAAPKDWKIFLAPGTYTALATVKAVRERYQTQEALPEYSQKFKFRVEPGENIFVVNYSCHKDKPKIYARRIELGHAKGIAAGCAVTKIIEVLKVY